MQYALTDALFDPRKLVNVCTVIFSHILPVFQLALPYLTLPSGWTGYAPVQRWGRISSAQCAGSSWLWMKVEYVKLNLIIPDCH